MWPRQFAEAMQPQYLPYLWSVDHKPEHMGSLEIKISKHFILGGASTVYFAFS